EEKIISAWEKSGVFAAPTYAEAMAGKPTKKPFCIIMPPPNASDPLHVGHTMFVTIEDILIRYHRMKGDATLWLPGTDHAGIETQFVFEKKLAKQGKSRYDFDRKTLYQMISDYVAEFSEVSVQQMKRLGASADWSRFKFTLDDDVVAFVLNTFEKLFKDGLVYRGERLVNYCVKCGTSYSELEVEYEEKNGKLYYIKYPLADGGEVIVATTRPETMFGDTAVAVNQEDNRYKKMVGKMVRLPLTDRMIPIIADVMVEKEFGTGAVKITPAHDMNDYETGKSHSLPLIQVIDFSGRMTEATGEFAGMKVESARAAVIERLGTMGLIDHIKEYTHNVGTCYRCHSVIEPLPLAQFFVKTKLLAEKALKALEKGETVVLGAGRDKILINWLTNIKDWNISRQIVWGIRMPIWYDCEKNPEMEVGFLNQTGEFVKGKLSEMLKLGHTLTEIEVGLQTLRPAMEAEFVVSKTKPGENFLQETDTFDTWFSSGQWSVVTLVTNRPGDLEFYYPTTVIESGYDILTIWIMRMMLLSIYLTGKTPFKWVYLHGLIRDEQGRKMSKSIGNVVNPLDLVEKYGADALRMALVMSTTPGNDSNVGESKVRGMRNLANKIWNAARYVANTTSEESSTSFRPPSEEIFAGDDQFKEKLGLVIEDVSRQLDDLKIGLAAETIYNEFWHWYCDAAIEANKKGDISSRALKDGLAVFLKLLHPFVPFVTEAIWAEVFPNEGLLTAASWPSFAKTSAGQA
ncbi:MAG: valine--tRNA ligase, partial [Patescibacteria group bacterium]